MSVFSIPTFTNQRLWQQAMTHSSFSNEPRNEPSSGRSVVTEHNERLEFLGDAILTAVSGIYLYARYPNRPEGELTSIRAALVDRSQLCRFAQSLSLGKHLRLGKGAEQEGGRESARLLCSAFEAMIGAYFLDAGQNMQAVSDYVLPMFDTVVEQAVQQGINVKSRLQEWAQKTLGETPEYVVVSSSGPDHAKAFVVEVKLGDTTYGRGQGRSKKEAEKIAASAAIAFITARSQDLTDDPTHP